MICSKATAMINVMICVLCACIFCLDCTLTRKVVQNVERDSGGKSNIVDVELY